MNITQRTSLKSILYKNISSSFFVYYKYRIDFIVTGNEQLLVTMEMHCELGRIIYVYSHCTVLKMYSISVICSQPSVRILSTAT